MTYPMDKLLRFLFSGMLLGAELVAPFICKVCNAGPGYRSAKTWAGYYKRLYAEPGASYRLPGCGGGL